MRKKDDSQFPLNLPDPVPVRTDSEIGTSQKASSGQAPTRSHVYSFTDKKVEKERSEAARHFRAILRLVRHFK